MSNDDKVSRSTSRSRVRTDEKNISAPQRALKKLGLVRDIDLALHLPMRYENQTQFTTLSQVRDGQAVQFLSVVKSSEIVFKPRRQLVVQVQEIFSALASANHPQNRRSQESLELQPENFGEICTLRFFNFYPSIQKSLTRGHKVRLNGEIKVNAFGKTIIHPSIYPFDSELPKGLTPVYPASAGLSQAYLKRAIKTALDRCVRRGVFEETLPEPIKPLHLWRLDKAVQFLHEPDTSVDLEQLNNKIHPAWQRLKAEELLAQQISQLRAVRERQKMVSPKLAGFKDSVIARSGPSLTQALLEVIPFELTHAQRRVVNEIGSDISKPTPMHRLLQGDVGSGKTVVAALAASQCIDSGYQCVLMAPTEILAEQHFKKLVGWLAPLLEGKNLAIAWLAGSQKKTERLKMIEMTHSGQAALVIGTHAVIQESVQFSNLGLVVIDEQHRFGVEQRLALKGKLHEREPHLLMMSATPIPRTLAMSYYADLDVSTIDELPPGRTPVTTKVVSEQRREEVIMRIKSQLELGRQVYWVCPLIEESEALDLTNATQTHESLQSQLQEYKVGLLHSKMPAIEKKAVMLEFTNGKLDVLVSTTVIEVGVDVPNASLMVIEHAERFGLSQLHQLRGRVGRGAVASACVLMYSTGESGRISENARERLKAMAQTQDGFEIARRDLEIRGPGEFLGARQSGAAMLRFADLSTDIDWLDWARQTAPKMLDGYPHLAELHISRWLGHKLDYLKA